MAEDDTVFIELLKYGAEIGLEGITIIELEDWAVEKGFLDATDDSSLEDQSHQQKALENLFQECFYITDNYTGDIPLRVLKNEYYFRLIEYKELQESRRTAKQANRNAFIAIGISVSAIIISALMTWSQLKTPTTIKTDQLNALITATTAPKIQNVHLNDNQIKELKGILEDTRTNEVILSKKQLERLLNTIKLNKPIQPTVNVSEN